MLAIRSYDLAFDLKGAPKNMEYWKVVVDMFMPCSTIFLDLLIDKRNRDIVDRILFGRIIRDGWMMSCSAP